MKKLIRFVFFVSCFVLVPGCKPKEIIIHDIEYRYKTQIDSVNVYKHDSIRITQRGDTVYYQTFKTLYRDRIKLKTDSVDKYIRQQTTTTKYIEKPLKPWQKALINTGILSILLGIIFIIYKLKNKLKLL